MRYPLIKGQAGEAMELKPNQAATRQVKETLPAGTPPSQPYWLREDPTAGMFVVDDAALIGRPENPPAFPVEQVFEVGGQTLVVPDEPVQVAHDSARGEYRRRWM